jgi:hypothetical protein
MPAIQQGGVTQADIFGHGNDDWDEIVVPPEDEYEILEVKI